MKIERVEAPRPIYGDLICKGIDEGPQSADRVIQTILEMPEKRRIYLAQELRDFRSHYETGVPFGLTDFAGMVKWLDPEKNLLAISYGYFADDKDELLCSFNAIGRAVTRWDVSLFQEPAGLGTKFCFNLNDILVPMREALMGEGFMRPQQARRKITAAQFLRRKVHHYQYFPAAPIQIAPDLWLQLKADRVVTRGSQHGSFISWHPLDRKSGELLGSIGGGNRRVDFGNDGSEESQRIVDRLLREQAQWKIQSVFSLMLAPDPDQFRRKLPGQKGWLDQHDFPSPMGLLENIHLRWQDLVPSE